ncbi:MAG: prepilin-type N-terminal cleavage/methylation domain-containing protein [Candidatus Omnitrophica bacterium]|nr:prepilin-type N-terminal cleavage/methylation domain-containing protein [Candidatus Omnitrophota bacterium]
MFISRKAKGFTLVEIMIVVAIIALIAAIAIPNLLRARHNANETAAIGNLKTLVDSLESFRANQAPTTYPGAGVVSGAIAVTNLVGLSNTLPPYIDAVLASGTRQGYTFAYAPGAVRVVTINGVNFNVYDTYTIVANPVTPSTTGTRGFFVDETGVIRVAPVAPANAASVPLE